MEEAATDQQPNQAAPPLDQNDDIESKPAQQQQSLVRGDAVRRSKASTVEQEKEGYLNRRSFIANFILLLGYTFGLWFQVYEFQGRDRTTIAITVYFVAFVLLILSGLLELSVDIFSTRTVGHGRYHSTSERWNRFISLLFISAGILDIIGFVYWMQREPITERQVLLVSAYVLFVMAIIVIYFQIVEVKKDTWSGTLSSDKVDLVANGIVLVVTILGVVLRHTDLSSNDYGDATDRLELATVPIWLFTSILYTFTDLLRLQMMIEEGNAWY